MSCRILLQCNKEYLSPLSIKLVPEHKNRCHNCLVEEKLTQPKLNELIDLLERDSHFTIC